MSKGTKREREACEILKRAGYAVYRPATVRYGENDVFGLFDVLAFAPDCIPRFVQVKSNSTAGLKDWIRHTRLWREHGIKTEYWIPRDNEGWDVYDAGKEPQDKRRSCRRVYSESEDGDVGPYRDTWLNMGDGVVRWLCNE
jgi:hypothetical protein